MPSTPTIWPRLVAERDFVGFEPARFAGFEGKFLDDAEFRFAGRNHLRIVLAKRARLIGVVEIEIRLADETLEIGDARVLGEELVAAEEAQIAILPENPDGNCVDDERERFGGKRMYEHGCDQ